MSRKEHNNFDVISALFAYVHDSLLNKGNDSPCRVKQTYQRVWRQSFFEMFLRAF